MRSAVLNTKAIIVSNVIRVDQNNEIEEKWEAN